MQNRDAYCRLLVWLGRVAIRSDLGGIDLQLSVPFLHEQITGQWMAAFHEAKYLGLLQTLDQNRDAQDRDRAYGGMDLQKKRSPPISLPFCCHFRPESSFR